MAKAKAKMTRLACTGRAYGHVPGHDYLDVEIFRRKSDYLLRITWGSDQGYEEEHGREEYARETIGAVRDVALRRTAQRGRWPRDACSDRDGGR